VPDTREHRGPHPSDAQLFAPAALPRLREAVADFSLLLTKGYADKSALKLVGDRFSLTQRQRLAVMRSSCSDRQRQSRWERRVPVEALAGRPLAIDGYNLLITIEAALSGGLIFQGRDGCCRDLASIHGTYRKVEETIPAVKLIGEFLTEIRNQAGTGPGGRGAAEKREPGPEGRGEGEEERGVEILPPVPRPSGLAPRAGILRPPPPGPHPSPPMTLWLLDSPVSNSGRLKTLIGQLARENDWPWDIRLTISPDAELSKMDTIVVSTDSVVLDACQKWTNLTAAIITQRLPQTMVIDLALPVA
jgi:hypothetical protein